MREPQHGPLLAIAPDELKALLDAVSVASVAIVCCPTDGGRTATEIAGGFISDLQRSPTATTARVGQLLEQAGAQHTLEAAVEYWRSVRMR